jgi:hypothetical protein
MRIYHHHHQGTLNVKVMVRDEWSLDGIVISRRKLHSSLLLCIAARSWNWGSVSSMGNGFFCQDQLWSEHSSPLSGQHWGSLHRCKVWPKHKINHSYLHLVPRLRVGGAVTVLPPYTFMVWYLIKWRDNFIFYVHCFTFLRQFPSSCLMLLRMISVAFISFKRVFLKFDFTIQSNGQDDETVLLLVAIFLRILDEYRK